jgi:antitoxin YefM
MKAITYSAARQELAKTMDNVVNDAEPVIITRNRDQSVVMISLEEYESLNETAYLLRSPKNAIRLMESIQELSESGGSERDLVE